MTQRRVPAEWEPHSACWTAWPTHRYAWGDALESAQRQAAAFIDALVQQPGGERVRVLNAHVDGAAMAPLPYAIDSIPYGDIWLRDTGPVFVVDGETLRAISFRFDGWGGKYRYPHDTGVARAIAARAGLSCDREPLALEGGALELDGRGTLLTTRSCLLDPLRNRAVTQAQVEDVMAHRLGVRRTIWLQRGLCGDHTDGHIDNLARFVAPATVLCARADDDDDDDPNREVLGEVEQALRSERDADDTPLTVHTLPSAGLVQDSQGAPLAASYLNFYIGNAVVIVPAFGKPTDAPAAAAIAARFPDRKVISLPADALLLGGGTFHCMSRQQPAHSVHGRRD